MSGKGHVISSQKAKNLTSYREQEYSFVEAVPDEFICPICHQILQEPLQTTCGHLFCKQCLITIACGLKRKKGVKVPCPTCRNASPGAGFPDKHTERKISNLRVNCDNNSCNWVGALGLVAEHKSDEGNEGVCQFEFLDCTLKCGERMIRKNLENHMQNDCSLRKVFCQYCNRKGQPGQLNEHYRRCPEYPLNCPNNCGRGNIPVRSLEEHLEVCPEQLVNCCYSQLGCTARLKGKCVEEHNASYAGQHLALSGKRLDVLSKTLLQVIEKVNKSNPDEAIHIPACLQPPQLWLVNTKLSFILPRIVCMDEYSSIRNNWLSSPFYSSLAEYKLRLKITLVNRWKQGPSDRYLEATILASKDSDTDPESLYPESDTDPESLYPESDTDQTKPTFAVSLLNQDNNKNHHTKTVPITKGKDNTIFISEFSLRTLGVGNRYLLNDCMFFQVEQQ